MPKILIIEDEPAIVLSLEEDLRRQGYETHVSIDGEQGIQSGKSQPWDLILLDVMLPKIDGFEVCAELRRSGVKTPIILLTARSQEAEKIVGLDAGADDYITKPFSQSELRARIRAQLRRSAVNIDRVVCFGDCEIDLDRMEVRRSGKRLDLTAQEFRLLEVFSRNAGRVMTRDQLIDAAWGQKIAITDRAVDTHVFNLRKKLEPNPSEPRYLVGVRGLGYRFERDG